MAKSHFVELDAVAGHLLSALGQYEEDVVQLVQGWSADPDMEHYARVSRQIDGMRDLCGLLPLLAAQWVTVLISHAELMHALWRISQSHEAGLGLGEHLQDHRGAIEALRAKCRRLVLPGKGQRFC